MKHMKNTKVWNLVFVCVVFLLYIICVWVIYKKSGINDWNFKNVLPTANVSPFMFASSLLILVLPKNIKQYFLVLVSLLSVGMVLSGVINCIYNAVINYNFHIHFFLDYLAHFVLSLWGVYIVKSEQVELNKKNCFIGSFLIYCVLAVMLVLNVVFDRAFFGLSLNGKHNIYNMVLVSNSYLSALIYIVGLGLVLFLGYCLHKTLNYKKFKSKVIKKDS